MVICQLFCCSVDANCQLAGWGITTLENVACQLNNRPCERSSSSSSSMPCSFNHPCPKWWFARIAWPCNMVKLVQYVGNVTPYRNRLQSSETKPISKHYFGDFLWSWVLEMSLQYVGAIGRLYCQISQTYTHPTSPRV